MQSEAGLRLDHGTPDTPSKVGLSIADIAGGMYAYSGILTALLQRQRTGEGAALDVSLFDALGEWMGYAMYYTMGGARRPGRAPATRRLRRMDPTRRWMVRFIFGLQTNREWGIVLHAGASPRPELVADERFQSKSPSGRSIATR